MKNYGARVDFHSKVSATPLHELPLSKYHKKRGGGDGESQRHSESAGHTHIHTGLYSCERIAKKLFDRVFANSPGDPGFISNFPDVVSRRILVVIKISDLEETCLKHH